MTGAATNSQPPVDGWPHLAISEQPLCTHQHARIVMGVSEREMSIREVRAQLPALVDRAEHGETTIITRHGQPKARIAPLETPADKCPRCKGAGYFEDARYAGVTHRRTVVRMKCRNCKGTGRRPAAAPEETVIGEIPEWMLE